MKSIFFLFLLFPALVFAQAQVFPTRLTLTEEAPSSYLNLKNSTDKPQKYRIELVQFTMQKDGSSVKTDASKNPVADILKFSPKTVVIAPNEKQVVRVMATSFEGLADGEYYVHLHFIPESENGSAKPEASGRFSLQARIAVAVPLIVRKGTAKIDAQVSGLKASYDKNGNLNLNFRLSNSTKYFLTGDLEISALTAKGETSLYKTTGVSSYLPEREVKIAVSKNDIVQNLQNEPVKKIKIRYASNIDSGSSFNLTAESEIGAEPKTFSKTKKSSKRR